MNKINYEVELEKIISDNKSKNIKPTLLLHCCCAPCSTTAITRLKDDFDITAYFYNPNMDTDIEYLKRAEELKKFCAIQNVKVIQEEYNQNEFFDKVKGYEKCSEGGERCFICYKLRLDKTANTGSEMGFDYFATTLTLSPLKNAEKINTIGYETEKEYKIKYLPSDFKKKGGYLLSIELSKEYNMYRQNYCGCVFSKR